MQRTLLLLMSCLAASGTTRGDGPVFVDRGPYALPLTHEFSVSSPTGKEYRIFVAEPAGTPPEAGFPVLYLLDANASFGTAAEAVRLQSDRTRETGVSPSVIVGIGYPGDHPFDQVRRTYDFTTPADVEKLPKRPNRSTWPPNGGADEFLDFLDGEVKPEIERRFKIDRRRQAIFGHSLGGLLVLHALFTRPNSFESYIAASPSVWWNDYALLSEERAFVERCRQSPPHVRVRITTAELEKGGGPAAALPATEASKAFGSPEELASRLSALGDQGVAVEFQEFPGENHGSVLPLALGRGLRFASGSSTASRSSSNGRD